MDLYNFVPKVLVVACIVALPWGLRAASDADNPEFEYACASEESFNTGQDITRPVRRFDIRYQYVNFPRGADRNIVIFRTDQPFRMSKRWIIDTRLDVPLMCGKAAYPGRRYKHNQFALSDIFTQFIATYYASQRWAYGVGIRLLWPTAYRQNDGLGKYIANPLVGAHVCLPEISPGSFFECGVLYAFDYAGKRDYKHISRIGFWPTFHVMLSQRNFITLYANQEIVYDFVADGFMWPFDITLGRMIGRSLVASIEAFIPMFRSHNYKPWDCRVEARIGIFF